MVRPFPTRAPLSEAPPREGRRGPNPPSRLVSRGGVVAAPPAPGAVTRSLEPPSEWPDWGAGARGAEPGGASVHLPGPGRRGGRVRRGSAGPRAGHRRPSPRRRAPRRVAAQAGGRAGPPGARGRPAPSPRDPAEPGSPDPPQTSPRPPGPPLPCRAPRIAPGRLRVCRKSLLLQSPASQPASQTLLWELAVGRLEARERHSGRPPPTAKSQDKRPFQQLPTGTQSRSQPQRTPVSRIPPLSCVHATKRQNYAVWGWGASGSELEVQLGMGQVWSPPAGVSRWAYPRLGRGTPESLGAEGPATRGKLHKGPSDLPANFTAAAHKRGGRVGGEAGPRAISK